MRNRGSGRGSLQRQAEAVRRERRLQGVGWRPRRRLHAQRLEARPAGQRQTVGDDRWGKLVALSAIGAATVIVAFAVAGIAGWI